MVRKRKQQRNEGICILRVHTLACNPKTDLKQCTLRSKRQEVLKRQNYKRIEFQSAIIKNAALAKGFHEKMRLSEGEIIPIISN